MKETKKHNQGEFAVSLQMDIGEWTLDASEIKQLYYIEDIFSYSMVGKIIFTDNRGIFEFGPLTGNERVRLVYGEEEDVELNFKIYKVNRIDQMNTNDETGGAIELFFAEDLFFIMNFLQFSKSWKDIKISDIVRYIGENHLEIDRWDKWENSIERLDHFYMPFWDINTTLDWLTKRATGMDSEEPGFCFFTNPRGANFVTLDKMLMEPDRLQIGDNLYVFQDVNQILYNKIINWSISGIDMSGIRQISGGVLQGFNSDEKSFKQNKFNYEDSSGRQTILGNKTLFPDISEERVFYKNIGEDSGESLDTIYHNNWHKRYAHQQFISITCRGHEDRHCGGSIEIKWPSSDIDEHYNKHLHGDYLVKSITHTFSGYTKPSYKQKMVLIKNGYSDSYVDDLLDSKKKI